MRREREFPSSESGRGELRVRAQKTKSNQTSKIHKINKKCFKSKTVAENFSTPPLRFVLQSILARFHTFHKGNINIDKKERRSKVCDRREVSYDNNDKSIRQTRASDAQSR